MNFYSYHYIESQTHTQTFVQVAFMATLVLVLLLIIIRAHKKKMPYKYKEIGVLILVLIVLLGGIQVNDLVNKEHTQSQYRGELNQMKKVAKDLHEPISTIYSNHMTPEEITVYKAGQSYYRVEFNENDTDHYLLEQIHVLNGATITFIDK
ncbi:DUF3290 family protein [Sporolactobacillus kofuensis]|uniref:DUF3290 family protein n=1 Tax=Sporolactobacillus kofuensis TaxID=269672 RepID=A0ABW1WGP7_9BACL|nr:DUF3290 family protein [Sporolactobacillus kofuensis]MCO7176106.1 DUF3290 domain-containing protein [Sporolactobacillus kofuensis]